MNIPLLRGAKINTNHTFFQNFRNLFFTLFITRWTREGCIYNILLAKAQRLKEYPKMSLEIKAHSPDSNGNLLPTAFGGKNCSG